MAFFSDAGSGFRSTIAAWYAKKEATFSGALAFARRAIWAGKYFVNSKSGGDRVELSCRNLDALLDQLAAVA